MAEVRIAVAEADPAGVGEAQAAYEGLVAAFQAVNQAVKEALGPFDITPAQFGALRRIEEEEEVSLSELARRLGCTNANVTRLIDHMVRAGLVEKVAHPSDQRVVLVRITSQGASIRRAALGVYSEAVDRVMKLLHDRELSVLRKLGSRL
jgi:DNA-binding MarR family transcriptional regulator